MQYVIFGTTIEVAKGGKTARAVRPVKYDGDKLIQTAAASDFVTDEKSTAQAKATEWAKRLPKIETPPPAEPERKPAKPPKETK